MLRLRLISLVIQEGFEPPTHGLEGIIDTYYTFYYENIVYIFNFLFNAAYSIIYFFTFFTLLQLKMHQSYLRPIKYIQKIRCTFSIFITYILH